METTTDLAPRIRATMTPLRLWVVSLFFANVSAVLIPALQSSSEPSPARVQAEHARERGAVDLGPLHAAFAPTVADATGALHAGRHADDTTPAHRSSR